MERLLINSLGLVPLPPRVYNGQQSGWRSQALQLRISFAQAATDSYAALLSPTISAANEG